VSTIVSKTTSSCVNEKSDGNRVGGEVLCGLAVDDGRDS
jgi:hypothetical protein